MAETLFFHWQHRCSCPWPNHAKAFNILWCCSFTEQRWQLGLPATSFELQNIELFFQNGNRVVKQLGKADPRWVITITNHIKVIPLAHARAFTHTSKAPETKLTSNIVVKNPRESLLAIIIEAKPWSPAICQWRRRGYTNHSASPPSQPWLYIQRWNIVGRIQMWSVVKPFSTS